MSIFEPNNSGTVAFTNGSAAITGVGTLFKSYRAGSVINIPGLGSMQLAADPTSDTAAVGLTPWQGGNTGAKAFQYLPRNEQATFSAKLTALLEQLGGGTIQALAGLVGVAGKLVRFTGPGVVELVDAVNLLGGTSDALVLSLTSGVPVLQSDVAGASTVYVMPIGGSSVGLFDGTTFNGRTVPAEIAISLLSGAHAANSNFDIFAAFVGGNVVAGTGPAWATGGGSANARGTGAGSTELEVYQGRIVNKNAITLTNGATTYNVPARRAMLIGGIRTTAAGQTEDSALKRFVSNALCPQIKKLQRPFSDATYTYSTATLRQSAGNANNKVALFQVLAGRVFEATMQAFVFNSTSTERAIGVGIGLNSTTTDAGTMRGQQYATLTRGAVPTAFLNGACVLGLNEVIPLERGNGTDVQSWYATSGSGNTQTGLTASAVV